MTMPQLEFDKVTIAYGDTPAVRDLSFSVASGEILGIVGESGSGKSTLLRAALRLLGPAGRVSAGRILCEGRDVGRLSEEEMRRLRGPQLGMVFQDCLAALAPTRRIGDLFYEEVAAHGNVTRAECEARAVESLRRLNLAEPGRILASYPFELSGGIGQRVGIALALALRPKLILADEPTSALDAVSQKLVMAELSRLRDEEGMAIVLVTHNIGVARTLADEVLVLKDGRMVECGRASDVLHAPKSAYARELVAAVPHLEAGRRDV